MGTTGLVRSTKCDGIAGSRHLICARSCAGRKSASALTGRRGSARSAGRRKLCAAESPRDNKKLHRQDVRAVFWWSSSNLKRIIKYTILNHQINVFAFFRGIPKNDDKSSIFQHLYMLLVSNRCRHLRFARHNTQAILESVLLL